jgi:hypothetical protein
MKLRIGLALTGAGFLLTFRRRSYSDTANKFEKGGSAPMFAIRKLMVALALTLPANADPLLYVSTAEGNFGTLDPTTGAFNQIGPTLSDPLAGLVLGPNGYEGVSFSGNLDSVNPATGAVTVIGATGLGGYALCTAVLGGTVYATDFYGNLYTVNKMTGAASLIGYTGIPSVPAYQKILGSNLGDDESFFGINGKLYATFDVFNISTEKAVFGPELYEINPTTGVATIVGPTSLYIDAVAEVDGTVYAFAAADQELSLDLATGKTTFVRDYDPAVGIIFGAAPSPEPVSLGLAGAGMAAILILRRKRGLKIVLSHRNLAEPRLQGSAFSLVSNGLSTERLRQLQIPAQRESSVSALSSPIVEFSRLEGRPQGETV